MGPEIEMTMRVAVLAAADVTRAQIMQRLGITDTEMKMAFIRLRKVATTWKT
jgi:hypothetical protein